MAAALQSVNEATRSMLEGMTPDDVARLTQENAEMRGNVDQIQKSLLASGADAVITDAEADELLSRYGVTTAVMVTTAATTAVVPVVVAPMPTPTQRVRAASAAAAPERETRVLAPA